MTNLRQGSVTDEYSRPVPGANIYVYDDAGNEAVLTSDGVTPLEQPVTTDQFGNYTYYAPDGVYREDTWFAGKLRYREAEIGLGGAAATAAAMTVASRAVMAAIPAVAGATRVLAEGGRSGTFVFQGGNQAAQVAADPQQGLYVAPTSDPTGASGAWLRATGPDLSLSAEWFGLSTAGTAANNRAAINAALAAANALGRKLLTIPAQTYTVNDNLLAAGDGVRIVAHGAVVQANLGNAGKPLLTLTGAGVRVEGGTWRLTGANDNDWVLEVTGTDCFFGKGGLLEKTPDTGGYQAYVRNTATGFTFDGGRTAGSNGIFNEASQTAYLNSTFRGRAAGGDDGIAIKAIQGITHSVRIEGNVFVNLAAGLSIGSEIGTAGANDAGYSKAVRGVSYVGNTLFNCYGIAYIKPGAIAGIDYRDGTVEGVTISDNTLYDPLGTKCERPITITPGRGARVWRVHGKGNVVVARCANSGGRRMGVDIMNLDYGVGSAAPDVSSVDVEIDITDPWNGAANGAGGAPGYPFTHVVSVSNATIAVGTMSDIVLDVRGNGSADAGLNVGFGLGAGNVRVRNLRLRNVNQINSANGCAIINSEVDVRNGCWSVAGLGVEYTGAAGFTSQVVSKDSGLQASGPVESFQTIPTCSMDVNGTAGRIVTFQNGVGYRNLELEAAQVLIRPAGATSVTFTGAVVNLAAGINLQYNGANVLVAGVLAAAAHPALTGDVTSVAGALATTIANGVVSTAKMGGDVTAAGKAILDDADATAQRATLGLGTAATQNTGTSGAAVPLLNGANTWSGQQTFGNGKIAVTSAGLAQIDVRDSTNGGGTIKFRNAADSASHALIVVSNTPTMTFQCDNFSLGDTALANTFITCSASTIALKAANATVATITSTGLALTGAFSATGNILSSGGGVGYATGAGGTVAQLTSKTTAVTLNKVCGQFTTNNAALAAAALATFQVNNSNIAATDTVNLNLQGGQATNGTYRYWIEKVQAGSFLVTIENRSAGALGEALVFNFAAVKAVAA